jgi:translation initiation factor IF-2
MPSIGTRLFKIASQINIGKETIVAFLQSKGFAVENKATTTLSDEMTSLVLDNFQKELGAAEKQRAKTTVAAPKAAAGDAHAHSNLTADAPNAESADVSPSADAVHDGDAGALAASDAKTTKAKASAKVGTKASGKAQSSDDSSAGAASEGDDSSASQPVGQAASGSASGSVSGSVSDSASDFASDFASGSAAASGVSVGSVISLDGLASGRRSKSKKDSAESGSTVAKGSAKGSATSATKAIADTAFDAEESTQTSAKASTKASAKDSAKEGTASSAKQASSASAEDENIAQTSSESSAGADASAAKAHNVESAESGAGANAGTDEHDEHDDQSPKKRRRKIGEIEYAATGNYASEIPKPNLTILGRIDLDAERKAQLARRNAERESARDSRGGGGRSSSGSGGASSGGRGAGSSGSSGGAGSSGANRPAEKTTIKVKGVAGKVTLGPSDDRSGAKKKRKKGKREQVSADDVNRAIRRTLAGSDDSVAMRSKIRQKRRAERAEQEERDAELRELEDSILRVTEFITVAELANIMGVGTNEVIVKCMGLGLMVSINQRLEKDTITLIADDYGFSVEFEDAFAEEEFEDEEDDEDTLVARAPIVTVMGHVDHGKTSLLDYIRSASVVTGESGGITQHIGAYSVKMPDSRFITFLDTPGHQAFTAMRARGAQVTDLVVLVVAADDNVMPQTIEAISHARAAEVPMVVAINKIDKPEANPDRIRQQLADQNVLVEEWGGKFQSVEISAKKGLNMESLLEKILLEAELLNLRANPDRAARGTVVESKVDKGKGPVATIIVQKGTLKVGDPFICGVYAGRVRAMLDEKGERIEEAIPSTPVQLLGLDGVPQAGDGLTVMRSESEAKELANQRQQIKREQDFKQVRHVTLDDLAQSIQVGGTRELKIILKGDTDGSVEALADSLQKLATPEVSVSIIFRAVGAVSESDVMLAAASDAVIVAFHVRPPAQIAKLAENEGVEIRQYQIIYDCINDVKLALEGMLRPEVKEEVAGAAEIREVFRISKLGNIAGCYMLEGKINRNDTVRVIRDGFEVYTNGKLASLKRIKDDVREVDAGFECGIAIDGFNDIKVGDIIEAVRRTEVKRKL